MKYFATISAKVGHFGQLNLFSWYNASLILSVITKHDISLWHQRAKEKSYYRNGFLAQYLFRLLTRLSIVKNSPQQKSFVQVQVLFIYLF